MAIEGITRPSSSPWCAPVVYVPKSNGDIRICVDFVQPNKVTKKDAYPVPRTEGPLQKLANKCVFSKINLKSAYWQFPMNKGSIDISGITLTGALVLHGQTAFFSLTFGREKKSLEQFESHTRPDITTWLIG